MKLNERQIEAIHHIEGQCLVLAGAGSGKTGVITQKIVHLIEKIGISPSHITAVTFTNKAAKEMKERIKTKLSIKEAKQLNVSTFHTLGLTIMKSEAQKLNLKSNFTLFDDQDAKHLLIEMLNIDDIEFVKKACDYISQCKSELLSVDDAINHASSQEQVQLANIYKKYTAKLRLYHAVDFDDLIYLPVKLLQSNGELLSKWAQKTRYLLVDEYQDTNSSQYELIKLLTSFHKRFTVVGDDDQSIYSWRGANPQNINVLKNDFPKLKVIKLEQNYRSTNLILRSANQLIKNNPHEFEKKLYSEIGEGSPIRVIAMKNEHSEAERLVSDIFTHKFNNKANFSDYCVLYRSNHQSRLIEKIFSQNRIPYQISGSTSFFAKSEIKDILSYFRLLLNVDDDASFLRIVNKPKREIGSAIIQKINDYAGLRAKSFFESSCEAGLQSQLNDKQWEALSHFTRWIVQTQDNMIRGDTLSILKEFMSILNYENWLYEQDEANKVTEKKINNVRELLSWVYQDLESNSGNDGYSAFKDCIHRLCLREIMERQDDANLDVDQVQLMTLHAAKGLEFKYVYLIGAEEGILPHKNSLSMNELQIEEERRLMYVGITRAKRELTLTYCNTRSLYGDVIEVEKSRFIDELPQDDLLYETEQTQEVSADIKLNKDRQKLAMLKSLLE